MIRHRFGRALTACLGTVLCLFVAAAPVAAVSYSIADLGTLPGATSSSASDINNAGQIVGHSGGNGFFWGSGVMQNLGVLPGAGTSTAQRLNNSGQVVGSSGSQAFLWESGTTQNLGALPGDTSSAGYGINDFGHVVGGSGNKAFLWQGGTMQQLATPAGNLGATATAINNLGQIAGTSDWTAPCGNCNRTYGVLWQNATSTPSTFLPQAGHEERTFVARLNEFGEVVGYSNQTEPIERTSGFIRPTNGSGTLFQWSTATGLNNYGQVVGYNAPGPEPIGAFLWESETGPQALFPMITNGAGWSFINPLDINDNGWIVGTGTYNGSTRGFLLTPFDEGPGGGGSPVPEPGTLLLLGSALVWLGISRRGPAARTVEAEDRGKPVGPRLSLVHQQPGTGSRCRSSRF